MTADAGVPPRGSAAPPITLTSLEGEKVSTSQFAGRPLVLVFGELDHGGVQRTCADVLDVLADRRIPADTVVPIMVIAKDQPIDELRDRALEGRFPGLILHDPQREAFGAYRVLVLPSVVVVDAERRVVYAAPGFVPRFRDLLAESLLVATGRETDAQFEKSLALESDEKDPVLLRVERLMRLGDELQRHDLADMAEARYREAIALLPEHIPSRLALARLLVRDHRLDEAETQCREALSRRPDSVDAALVLAEVQISRPGDDLQTPERAIDQILEHDPMNARAQYLKGRIHEKRGEASLAAEAYRAALEILLNR